MSIWRFSCWGSLFSIAIMGINLLPGNYALAHINSGETTDKLKITAGSLQVKNNLLPNSSQLYVPNNNAQAGSLTIITRPLVLTDNARISSEHRNVNTLGNAGNITLNTNTLILTRPGSKITLNTNDITPTGLGGSLIINASSIRLTSKSVPEPTLTFSTLMSIAFYGAWKLKRKQTS
ncbi:hypothetical protein H6G76_06545 [Nostoc sp. FACHB-152]|uniref:hypothetical protein n=1 Tax=unclassified Nostoc TaxID=2593658 RepID=UPI0016833661|nr:MULTISPECIES: hypothetical protein [unclassified Nostoc]MBD2446828.1 hypothetical protein [Nostoc sp. FACHB-152]MBD2472056.1 hypothetical protein [Nostoc sp. FACHB-145]